jgi:hypothetical protein
MAIPLGAAARKTDPVPVHGLARPRAARTYHDIAPVLSGIIVG